MVLIYGITIYTKLSLFYTRFYRELRIEPRTLKRVYQVDLFFWSFLLERHFNRASILDTQILESCLIYESNVCVALFDQFRLHLVCSVCSTNSLDVCSNRSWCVFELHSSSLIIQTTIWQITQTMIHLY